jgi:hypothetical protein
MRRGLYLLLTAALAVGVSACQNGDTGGGGEERQGAGRVSAQSSSTSDSGTETAQPDVQPGKVIVSREFQSDESTVRVDITGLQRQGKLTTLSWALTVTGEKDWRLWTRMGRSGTDPTVSQVSLVDPVNAKRYRVAFSGGENGDCVCSRIDSSINMKKGESKSLYATFSAPPPDVTKVNVELPGLGMVADVPIS